MPDLLDRSIHPVTLAAIEAAGRSDLFATDEDPDFRSARDVGSAAIGGAPPGTAAIAEVQAEWVLVPNILERTWPDSALRGFLPLIGEPRRSSVETAQLETVLNLFLAAAPPDLLSPNVTATVRGPVVLDWTLPKGTIKFEFDRLGRICATRRRPAGDEAYSSSPQDLRAWLCDFTISRGYSVIAQEYCSGERASALDRLYAWVDDLQLAGRFADVDEVLAAAPVDRLPTALLLGLLTVTRDHRRRLRRRTGLLLRVDARLEHDDPGRKRALLAGLE